LRKQIKSQFPEIEEKKEQTLAEMTQEQLISFSQQLQANWQRYKVRKNIESLVKELNKWQQDQLKKQDENNHSSNSLAVANLNKQTRNSDEKEYILLDIFDKGEQESKDIQNWQNIHPHFTPQLIQA